MTTHSSILACKIHSQGSLVGLVHGAPKSWTWPNDWAHTHAATTTYSAFCRASFITKYPHCFIWSDYHSPAGEDRPQHPTQTTHFRHSDHTLHLTGKRMGLQTSLTVPEDVSKDFETLSMRAQKRQRALAGEDGEKLPHFRDQFPSL